MTLLFRLLLASTHRLPYDGAIRLQGVRVLQQEEREGCKSLQPGQAALTLSSQVQDLFISFPFSSADDSDETSELVYLKQGKEGKTITRS